MHIFKWRFFSASDRNQHFSNTYTHQTFQIHQLYSEGFYRSLCKNTLPTSVYKKWLMNYERIRGLSIRGKANPQWKWIKTCWVQWCLQQESTRKTPYEFGLRARTHLEVLCPFLFRPLSLPRIHFLPISMKTNKHLCTHTLGRRAKFLPAVENCGRQKGGGEIRGPAAAKEYLLHNP